MGSKRTRNTVKHYKKQLDNIGAEFLSKMSPEIIKLMNSKDEEDIIKVANYIKIEGFGIIKEFIKEKMYEK